jgi:hypothetical protein
MRVMIVADATGSDPSRDADDLEHDSDLIDVIFYPVWLSFL